MCMLPEREGGGRYRWLLWEFISLLQYSGKLLKFGDIGRSSNAQNMGKKGSWFSAIKRVFTHSSKEKPFIGSSDKKSNKEKKKNKGILSRGEAKSFIPLFREPSSIEKILGEADQLLIRPPTSSQQLKTPPALLWRPASPKVTSPKDASCTPRTASPRISSARITSPRPGLPTSFVPATAAASKTTFPRVTQNYKEISHVQRPEPTLRNQHRSALKIQAAYRGYLARRNFRALRGLVRLQRVVRGHNVKRQIMNAMKQMQLLVRVQTQIHSRRIQMLEDQSLLNQEPGNTKEVESTLGKWTLNQLPEVGQNEEWDDSLLTKEEAKARLRKKVEAVTKRERVFAYACSHQPWKDDLKPAESALDNQSNGSLWWWNCLEHQLPPASSSHSQAATRNIALAPLRPISEHNPRPRPNARNYKHTTFTFGNHGTDMPWSSRSAIPVSAKQFQTLARTPPPANSSAFVKSLKPQRRVANSPHSLPFKDDDSLASCPPFSTPNYMNPTVSAKAKVRASSNPKERLPGTPGNDSKSRFSFPLTPDIGSFKWNKGSIIDSSSQKVFDKDKSTHSIGDLRVDSNVPMPAMIGRKPVNRFV